MKGKAGFTLIELILVIVLIGIISGFVGGMLFQETNIFTSTVLRKEVASENELVIERILKDLRYAYRNEFNTGSNITFKIPYSSYRGYTTINYYLSGGKLYLKTNNASPKIIANNTIYFNITTIRANYSNYTTRLNTRNLVSVKIGVKKENQDVYFQTTVFFRNKR